MTMVQPSSIDQRQIAPRGAVPNLARKPRNRLRAIVACISTGLLLAACGGGSDDSDLDNKTDSGLTEVGLEPVGPAVERAIGIEATLTADADGYELRVLGAEFDKATLISSDGFNILPAMKRAVASGLAQIQVVDDGFYFISAGQPADIGLAPSGLLSISANNGPALQSQYAVASRDNPLHESEPGEADRPLASAEAQKASCPWLSFGYPTTVKANKNCAYNSTNCGVAGMAHTGIDYSGVGNAVAAADGYVVRTEAMSKADHGMGSNVIVKSTLSSCKPIYSSYSHLATIDKSIKVGKWIGKGELIGSIGASGYGDKSYWGSQPHLHFELKKSPVTGNPDGVGKKNKTCKTDAKNAGGSTCWGYVDKGKGADAYGYFNPMDYLGK
jgi:murein DD-endopeptidase MepM/ murein hydrolase activator NlpD